MKNESKHQNTFLFGYGTLRTDIKGYGNTPSFLKPLGFGEIQFPLYSISNSFGKWAGVKHNEKGQTFGQLFEIGFKDFDKAWKNLDYREQAESVRKDPYYFRRIVDVKLQSGQIIKAYVYFAHQDKTEFIKKIENGDWKTEIENK